MRDPLENHILMTASKTPKDLYKIKTIAALTGFNPTLLRAWERRYNLLLPTRTSTGHRLYTLDDLRVLRRVRKMIDEGRSIGEIVAQGRQRLLSQPTPGPRPEESTPLQFPELNRLQTEILQAALQLDDATIQRQLDRAFASMTATQVLEQLMIPAAREMGNLWVKQVASVASEHLLTQCFSRRLQRLIDSEERIGAHTHALCCGFPDEFHELGSLMLTYFLQLQAIHVTYLGAAVPFEDLARAIQIRRPQWVLLSVTRTTLLEVHKPALIQLIKSSPGSTRFLIGGLAIRPEDHPDLERLGITLWPPDSSLRQLQDYIYQPDT